MISYHQWPRLAVGYREPKRFHKDHRLSTVVNNIFCSAAGVHRTGSHGPDTTPEYSPRLYWTETSPEAPRRCGCCLFWCNCDSASSRRGPSTDGTPGPRPRSAASPSSPTGSDYPPADTLSATGRPLPSGRSCSSQRRDAVRSGSGPERWQPGTAGGWGSGRECARTAAAQTPPGEQNRTRCHCDPPGLPSLKPQKVRTSRSRLKPVNSTFNDVE